ncbi:acyl carrier protein [Luteibacter sp. E-22]|uniref:acyl carrier protein n=1 Tax=Luteibacter sp. E-22 TaxID=3404050 RepID=UPI003CEDE570
MTDTTLDKVTALVATATGKLTTEIKPDTNLIDDLTLDEIDRIELIYALENEFRIQIDETSAETLETVADIVRYIEACI